MDIIGLISFTAFLVVLVAVSYAAIVFGVKSRKQTAEIVQLNIDKIALLRQLEKALNEQEKQSLEQTDGFVKFLSESRDWAFQYIEDVQHMIFVLKEKYDDKEDMDESLKELFNMLPDNKENKNG